MAGRAGQARRVVGDVAAVDDLFSESYLVERPLLSAVKAGDSAVLLIDEIDRADDEFEAFLLELLSDFQVTIPELGTMSATSKPIVILTSNRTRELHDASNREGKAINTREQTHRMADANKAFAHFAW